ncbi:MAG: hypothetical protein ACHQ1D_00365 [Nitrososphaerales archaeon]
MRLSKFIEELNNIIKSEGDISIYLDYDDDYYDPRIYLNNEIDGPGIDPPIVEIICPSRDP